MYRTCSDPQQEMNLWCDSRPSTQKSESAKVTPATGSKRKRLQKKVDESISKRASIRKRLTGIMEQLQD